MAEHGGHAKHRSGRVRRRSLLSQIFIVKRSSIRSYGLSCQIQLLVQLLQVLGGGIKHRT